MNARRAFRTLAAASIVAAFVASASAATLDEIRAAYRQGNDAAAEAAARSLLAGTPTPYEASWARYLLGRVLERRGRGAEAVEAYETVPEADPSSTLADDALYYAGRILEADSPAGAVARYRRAVLLYPTGDFRARAEERLAALARERPTTAAAETRPAEPARPAPTEPRTVTIQFQDAEIRQFIRWVSEATGRNFVVSDNVQGKVTIYAGSEVPVEEIYAIFLAVLEVKGFSVVEGSGVSKIVTRGEAVRAEGPIFLGPIVDVPPDRVVTRIFRLRHAEAGNLANVLRPLAAPNDIVAVHNTSNAILVTGAVASIGRLAEAIEALDVAGAVLETEVIVLQYAPAEQAAATAREVVAGLVPPGGYAAQARVLSDARTNALVVVGDERARRAVRDLAGRLDADEAAKRRPRSIRLVHAAASEIAPKARELLGLDGTAGRGRLVADDRTNALYLTGAPPAVVEALERFVAIADTPGLGAGVRLHVYPLQNAAAEELAPVLSQLFVTAVAGGAPQTTVAVGQGSTPSTPEAASAPSGPVRIVAEPQTNALLITATPADYERMRPVIERLDARKRQVLVDALIVEASLDRVRALGVELNTLDPSLPFHTRAIGGTNFGQRPLITAGRAEGLIGGIFRGTTIGPTVQALQKSADVNVVSSPQILAEDNEEAEIFVGDLIPIVTSQVSSNINVGEGQTGIFQNVEYRNVGVRLKIKPHINEAGFITLEMQVQVEGVREAAVPNSALQLPSFTSRVVNTRSQVRDGDYVVIGGLIAEQEDRSVSKIPLLGDIPGLGYLFRRQTASRDKTNLIVFLRPRLVTDPDALERVTEEERGRYEREANPPAGRDPNSIDRVIPPEG